MLLENIRHKQVNVLSLETYQYLKGRLIVNVVFFKIFFYRKFLRIIQNAIEVKKNNTGVTQHFREGLQKSRVSRVFGPFTYFSIP